MYASGTNDLNSTVSGNDSDVDGGGIYVADGTTALYNVTATSPRRTRCPMAVPRSAGDPSGCTDDLGAPITTDQRGVPRPYGPACDAGAFEAADIIFRNGFDL